MWIETIAICGIATCSLAGIWARIESDFRRQMQEINNRRGGWDS